MNQPNADFNLGSRSHTHGRSMGQLLLDAGKIRLNDVEAILHLQKEQGLRFGEAAIRLGLIGDGDIGEMLATQFDYPHLKPGEGGHSAELIAAYAPFTTEVEALRALRSQLMLRWFDETRRTLAVVGSQCGDGASYLAANLAVVFSQLGERTLLIDANLREPRQHEIFRLPTGLGLSDWLSDRTDAQAIAAIPHFVGLSVLRAGTVPPNPQEMLSRPAFGQLLRRLETHYDIILIDGPAAGVQADAQSVAARAGGALIVARQDHARVATVALARKQLATAGAEVIGTVLSVF